MTGSRLLAMPAELARDRRGVAMLEFALALPVVLAIGAYGLEVANLAILNMRVSQVALTLADNASRVGTFSALSTQQLREVDVNDIFQAIKKQGNEFSLGTRGRITISSLENIQQSYDTAPVQRIHWQRCYGMKSGAGYDSSYGITTIAAGSDNSAANAGTTVTGMGPTGSRVTAPAGAGVMFIEVNYLTKPIFGSWLTSPARINQVASFIVRDRRDFAQLFNPSPEVATANRRTCNIYKD